MVNVSEALDINMILEYSSFENSEQETTIAADGFKSYDDIFTLGESDIANLTKGFSNRTVAAGKIIFVLRQTNFLKATINLAQYFRRISLPPSLSGISNTTKFCAATEAARQMNRIRKQSLEESASLNKAANTGKLKRHKECITWTREL